MPQPMSGFFLAPFDALADALRCATGSLLDIYRQPDKVLAVGNAASDGARAVFFNRVKRQEANWVSRNVEYIELTVESDFQDQFMQAMQVPHMKDQLHCLSPPPRDTIRGR